jgi:hypothetical protein
VHGGTGVEAAAVAQFVAPEQFIPGFSRQHEYSAAPGYAVELAVGKDGRGVKGPGPVDAFLIDELARCGFDATV